jgi:hypothetical protein
LLPTLFGYALAGEQAAAKTYGDPVRRLPLSARPSWGCSWEVGPGTSVGANRHLN